MRFSAFSVLTVVALLALAVAPIGAASTATATNNTTDDGLDAGDVRTVIEVIDSSGTETTTPTPASTPATSSPTTTETPNESTPITSTATPTASPQPTATTSTPAPSTPIDGNGTRIDSQTVIVNSEYRENESVALITIRSRSVQTLTFSDAGRFREGGTVPVTVEPMRPGETATFEIPVTEVDGVVGVAISTENTHLYAEIIERQSGGLDILRVLSSLQAWIAGIVVMLVWMLIAGWNEMRQAGDRPEVA